MLVNCKSWYLCLLVRLPCVTESSEAVQKVDEQSPKGATEGAKPTSGAAAMK